ncbi:hypothetical protein HMPREF7215_1607 [Pyramidobacter piscolens W5455]|uniref:Uncharacterized protein n=1 Tax=Pyramidobacter piscolens W5455 TaxID=352165 RepID=A0ABM9ZW30_9BACT|nr:hypothetical protein HMPREF7215_1607 [Pyramidobacter piscolens W5455]
MIKIPLQNHCTDFPQKSLPVPPGPLFNIDYSDKICQD